MITCSIRDIMSYRALSPSNTDEFSFFTYVPSLFEPYLMSPDFYCFGKIDSGCLQIEIDGKNYRLSPNSVMVYRPGEVFKVSKIDEGTHGGFVLFTKKFLDSLIENIFSIRNNSFLSKGMPQLIELSQSDSRKISVTFKEITTLLQHISKPRWELIAKNLTSALIYETDTILESYIMPVSIKINKEMELAKKFSDLVEQYFRSNRNLDFYASKLFISPGYLYVIIKRCLSMNPSAFINCRLLAEAKYNIAYTSRNIGEIAESLAFSDLYAFSKYFKKHTGFAPSVYRNLQQQ